MAEVKFKFVGDDSELRKKLANLSKIQSEMTEKFSKDLNNALSNAKSNVFKDITKEAANAAIQTDRLNKIAANKAIVNAKLEQIESIRRLREERSKEISNLITLKQIESEARTVLAEKRLITESLTQSEKALHNEYLRSGKDLNAYTLKLKEQAEERRKATQDERDAEKALKASEKARKEAEREAAKQAKETEKRKKQLEQESSEYYKLNKALGAVRKETKDVLAEMFRMERQGHANTLGYEALRKKSEDLTKQTLFLDRGIKKIDASLGLHQRNVGNYGSAIELLGPQFEAINQKLAIFGTSIDELAQKGGFNSLLSSLSNLGKGLLTFITTPIGAAITALGAFFMLFQRNKQTVIDFDAGMKNVAKTTGMAGQELSGFGDAIVELSMKLQVVSTDKLLEYATIAGQLGVKGRADILAFSESLAMLETASNIAGEEGGAQIARMLTLVDGGVQNVKAFGDEIVNLGNNFAATEQEILENATQISQNVGIYRIGRQEVLAFATATKAVGLEAELVGSTFSRTLGEFEKTLRTGKGVADLLKVIGGNQEDLQRKFRQDAAGVFVDYVSGLNNIQKTGGSVNEALERTGIIAVRDQRVISSLATNGFDVLTDALDNVKDAHGAMQTEFENGSSKLEQQLKRLGIAWDNLVLSIDNGEGAISAVFLRLIDGASILIDTLNKAFNPTSLNEFTARLTNLKAADKIREIELSMKEAGSTMGKFGSIDFTKTTQKQINDLAKETESSLKSVTSALNLYKTAVQNKELTEKGEFSISDLEEAKNKLSSKLYQLNLFNKNDANPEGNKKFEDSDEELRKREAAANKAARAQERAHETARQAMERQRSLQAQIDTLAEQSTRKQLSRDEEELASITDKYKKIREEVDKFYRDPKNAGRKVDTGKLAQAEKFEISESETRQGTTALIKRLNEQKEIYSQYTAFVEENGADVADRMFGDQAEIAKNYRKELQTQFDLIKDSTTQANIERSKSLQEAMDAFDKEERSKVLSKYADALKLAETFGEKEMKIRKEHSDSIKALEEQSAKDGIAITQDQKDVLDRILQDKLKSLLESEPEFQKAMEKISEAGRFVLPDAIQEGQDYITSVIDGLKQKYPELSAQLNSLEKKLTDPLKKASIEAKKGKWALVGDAVRGFEQLVNQAISFDDSLANSLRTVADMVDTVANLSNLFSEAGGGFSKIFKNLGGKLPIVGAIAGVVGSVISVFEAKAQKRREIEERSRQYSNDFQLNQINAITKALQYQLEIIQDIYGVDRVKAYEKAISDANKEFNKGVDEFNKSAKYQLVGNEFYDTLITNRNNGKKNAPGLDHLLDSMISSGAIKKAELGFKKIEDMTMENVQALEKMVNDSTLDEITREKIKNILETYNVWKDGTNRLKEEILGISFKGILDVTKDLFFNSGEDSADAWGKGFQNVMQDYLKNLFSREFLEKEMQGFYDKYDELAKSGGELTAAEKSELEDLWKSIQERGQAKLDQFQKDLGVDLGTSKKDDGKSLGGKIRREISEQTGSELAGLFRAFYENSKNQLTTQLNLLAIANDNLASLNMIQTNTANTVLRLDTAVVHLQQIVKNTGGTSGRTAEGMGL